MFVPDNVHSLEAQKTPIFALKELLVSQRNRTVENMVWLEEENIK